MTQGCDYDYNHCYKDDPGLWLWLQPVLQRWTRAVTMTTTTATKMTQGCGLKPGIVPFNAITIATTTTAKMTQCCDYDYDYNQYH